MKQYIIHVDELLEYMGPDNYMEFIDYLKTVNDIPVKTPLWIMAEWDE